MVNGYVITKQLHAIGADKLFWGKTEMAELPKIMIPGEIIEHVQHGRYEGGFATLVATNHRLLLVDKKLFFLNVVDLSYDKIVEVDFGKNAIAGTIHVYSAGKTFRFQSFSQNKLQQITSYIQYKIVQMRDKQRPNDDETSATMRAARQSIPMEVFAEDNKLTDEQANGLLPLTQAAWHKVNPRQHMNNTYNPNTLLNRRRVGRFDFANYK